MSHKLLREYVKEIIIEYDEGGFGSQKDLYNVFVKPFTDVVQTAAAETKKISQRSQTLLKVSFEAIVTSLIPAFGSDYDDIFDEQNQQLDKIKSQYKDVYDATYTSFKDRDVVISAFLYAPALFLTTKAAIQAPQVTAKLMNILTGGRLDSFVSKITKALKFGDTKKPLDRDNSGFSESLIREASNKEAKVRKALQSKKVLSVVQNSQKTKQIQSATQKIVNNSLKKVYEKASSLTNIKSIEQIEKLTNKKIKGIEELKKLKPNERAEAASQLMKGVKTATKQYYVKSLTATVKEVMSVGLTREHPFVQAYLKTISQINSL